MVDSWGVGVEGRQNSRSQQMNIEGIWEVITPVFKQFVSHNAVLQQAWFHFPGDTLMVSFSRTGSLSTRMPESQGTENEADSYDLSSVLINPSQWKLQSGQKVRTHTTTSCWVIEGDRD